MDFSLPSACGPQISDGTIHHGSLIRHHPHSVLKLQLNQENMPQDVQARRFQETVPARFLQSP